ncbi:metallophosphoesterase [Roseateles sp. BYS87W]|uniref:Metallophosphoesterase n=1 Tax=Pelomonas baiyunensis TaxID=3299026 RepID=A0ABW7H2E5_9BURK
MKKNLAYDLIGDIHGQAGKLQALLSAMGYVETASGWEAPPGRQAIFVGDLSDRGPEQVRVVQIVRSMVDNGQALAIMGNHEFNAIGFATPRRDGAGFLREHSAEKRAQHAEFLAQVGEGSALHHEILDWFRTLPLCLDLGELRVVHAWWHEPYVELVRSRHPGGAPMEEDFLHAAFTKGTDEWHAVEGIAKGLEVRLPDGLFVHDHAGVRRHDVRTRWWLGSDVTLQEAAILTAGQQGELPAQPMGGAYAGRTVDDVPVFIGHYWMQGRPVLQAPKVACLDWSAAGDGPLVAYRWDGEQVLSDDKWVTAGV